MKLLADLIKTKMSSLDTWVRIHTPSLGVVLKIHHYGKGVSKSTVLKEEKIINVLLRYCKTELTDLLEHFAAQFPSCSNTLITL